MRPHIQFPTSNLQSSRRRKDSNLRGSSPIRFQGGAVSPLRHSSKTKQSIAESRDLVKLKNEDLTKLPNMSINRRVQLKL